MLVILSDICDCSFFCLELFLFYNFSNIIIFKDATEILNNSTQLNKGFRWKIQKPFEIYHGYAFYVSRYFSQIFLFKTIWTYTIDKVVYVFFPMGSIFQRKTNVKFKHGKGSIVFHYEQATIIMHNYCAECPHNRHLSFLLQIFCSHK